MAQGRKAASGRGSAEAIEKRRVARQLNTIFSGRGKRGAKLDGRTEKRRQRLLKELRQGKNGEPLKAIEIITRADELLRLGETVSSIRKSGVKLPKTELPPDAREVIERAQKAYGFHPDSWKVLGVTPPGASGSGEEGARPTRAKRTSTKKSAGRKKAGTKRATRGRRKK